MVYLVKTPCVNVNQMDWLGRFVWWPYNIIHACIWSLWILLYYSVGRPTISDLVFADEQADPISVRSPPSRWVHPNTCQSNMSIRVKEYKFFRSLSVKVNDNWPVRKAEQLWRQMRNHKIAGIMPPPTKWMCPSNTLPFIRPTTSLDCSLAVR